MPFCSFPTHWITTPQSIRSQSQATHITLDNKTRNELGTTVWRNRVLYVHQSRVPLTGTPASFISTLQGLAVNRNRSSFGDNITQLFTRLHLEHTLLHTPWQSLSAGQAQRAYLACCIATKPRVLLLDHPTSSCCPETSSWVEAVLADCGAALVWVTHDPSIADRLGGRCAYLSRQGLVFAHEA